MNHDIKKGDKNKQKERERIRGEQETGTKQSIEIFFYSNTEMEAHNRQKWTK